MVMRLLRILANGWFAPAPAARPAVLRVLVGTYSLVYLWRRRGMLRAVFRTDPALFQPVGVARPLRRPIPARVARALVGATLVANVAFILGWRHRFTGPSFGGLLLWTLSYRNSWSMIYHTDNILVVHALVLGTTPSADAYSLDALARRGAENGPAATSWQYGWPIRLMNAVTVSTYFVAAVAKLRGPMGRHWISGEALRRQIAVDGLRKDFLGGQSAPLAVPLYRRPGLLRLLAMGSLAMEALAPAVLLDRRVARAWALNAYLMHVGIYLVMRISFRYQLSGVAFAPFFPVERLVDLVGSVMGRPRR